MNGTSENKRFTKAVEHAQSRERGMHGSVGTQNEKLIHAALKNYYAPYADEQEIKIGSFFADAVSENGIFEIQTKSLYRLVPKLRTFLEFTRVNVVHPVISESQTLFINSDSGEVVSQSVPRKTRSWLDVFEELYSLRELLQNENLTIIIVKLKIEKRVYFKGEKIPDLRSKSARKKCVIEKYPLELIEEIRLENPRNYQRFLPDNLPESFTKAELSKAAKESKNSLRTEVLRAAGIIEKIGKTGNSFIYKRSQND